MIGGVLRRNACVDGILQCSPLKVNHKAACGNQRQGRPLKTPVKKVVKFHVAKDAKDVTLGESNKKQFRGSMITMQGSSEVMN